MPLLKLLEMASNTVGLGTFTKDLTVSVGNATDTVLQSTCHAFKDVASGSGSFFEQILGGISGTIVWSVVFLIIMYLFYLKFSDRCIRRTGLSPEHILTSELPVTATTAAVTVPENHTETLEHQIVSENHKGVSRQSPPKRKNVFVHFKNQKQGDKQK